MSYIVAVISDIHSNSKVAVCPPAVTYSGGTWRANKAQHFLWGNFKNYWQEVIKRRGKGRKKKTLIVVINGEITDGDHHGTTEIIAPRNANDRLTIALATLQPMLEARPDEVYITAGTEAHAGAGSQEDETAAMFLALHSEIGAVPNSETGRHIWNHLLLEAGGVLFDIAHHGRTGNLPWTGPNAVLSAVVQMELYYHRRGAKLPQVAIRSHKHSAWDTYDNAPIRGLTTCGWQYPTQFVNGLAPGKFPDVGGLIFECENGGYEVCKKIYKPLPRKPMIAGHSLQKTNS